MTEALITRNVKRLGLHGSLLTDSNDIDQITVFRDVGKLSQVSAAKIQFSRLLRILEALLERPSPA